MLCFVFTTLNILLKWAQVILRVWIIGTKFTLAQMHVFEFLEIWLKYLRKNIFEKKIIANNDNNFCQKHVLSVNSKKRFFWSCLTWQNNWVTGVSVDYNEAWRGWTWLLTGILTGIRLIILGLFSKGCRISVDVAAAELSCSDNF